MSVRTLWLVTPVKRLAADTQFQQTVRDLREESWLDWHVLMSVASVVADYRMQSSMGEVTPENLDRMRRETARFFQEDEKRSVPNVPLDLFTAANLRMHLEFTMASTLTQLGLELHQDTPDFEAIGKYLGLRYRYWELDVPHDNYFSHRRKERKPAKPRKKAKHK